MIKCLGALLVVGLLAGCSTTERAEVCKVFSPAYIDTPVADELRSAEQLSGADEYPVREQRCD